MSPATPSRRPAGRPTVAVVGGGIAGLAAAWELTGGAAGPAADTPHVVVLEATGRLGGKLTTAEFCGRSVDLAADGFLGRRPEAAELCREVGLADRLRPVGASGASVWARGRARPLPAGLALGVPTRFWPIARSGILGWAGVARLAVDVVAPRADRRRPLGDRAIGPLIARKLGTRVVATLVDPMLGGIHAGSVADMSAAATYPMLLAVAQRRGSFMHSLRRAVARAEPGGPGLRTPASETDDGGDGGGTGGSTEGAGESTEGAGESTAPPPEPLFWAVDGGLATLADRLAERLAERGVEVRTSSGVRALARRAAPSAAWELDTGSGPVAADGIVLALPAGAAGALLGPHQLEAAKLLADVDHAPVATLTFSFPADAVPADLHGTGLLVPRHTRLAGTGYDDPAVVTAVTYLCRKWPHLARPGDVLLRASVGRIDDDRFSHLTDAELAARVVAELAVLVGTTGDPAATLVTRWGEALPQYRVHHLLRVTGIEVAAERLGAVAVAGAAYRGVGIPACVASGRAAARTVRSRIGVAAGSVASP